jgi:hypothetical protein
VVDGDGADVDEFGEVVFVGNVVAVPGDDVERRVVLRALEEFAAEFVDDLPRGMFDVVFCDWVEEVSGVS